MLFGWNPPTGSPRGLESFVANARRKYNSRGRSFVRRCTVEINMNHENNQSEPTRCCEVFLSREILEIWLRITHGFSINTREHLFTNYAHTGGEKYSHVRWEIIDILNFVFEIFFKYTLNIFFKYVSWNSRAGPVSKRDISTLPILSSFLSKMFSHRAAGGKAGIFFFRRL